MTGARPVIPRSCGGAYRARMTAPAASPSTPASAGLDTLHHSFLALLAGVPAPGPRRDVNGTLRALLDQHPELELLPLELLAQDVVGDRTRPSPRP